MSIALALGCLVTPVAWGQNLVGNGGFESDLSGWMYQQWDNKPVPGALDKEQIVEGEHSFRMGLPGATGGRWIAREVKIADPSKDYVVSFVAKGENLPANAARMRVAIDGKGFLGSSSGKVDIMSEGGTFPWRKYETTVRSSNLGGAGKITLFFYHDKIGEGSLWLDDISVTDAEEASPAAPAGGAPAGAVEPEDNTDNLVENGGFENGEKGWMWQQWNGRPLPGVIDRQDRVRGEASFKMGLPGESGGRWISKEIKLPTPRQNYILSFWLKPTDIPDSAAYVRLGIDGKGWYGSSSGKPDLARVAGTSEWKQYTIPLPADQVGDAGKMTIFFYHDKVGQGTLGIDALSLKVATDKDLRAAGVKGAGPTLTGETSKPNLSTFILGEEVELIFTISGISDDSTKLLLEIVDEHDRVIENKELAIAREGGLAEVRVKGPADRLGFYRVRAKLSDGTQLKSSGTRKAGFITYAVVPDPALRKDYGEKKSRFGMQGGFGPWRDEVLSYLGARWILDGTFEWRKNEPDRPGEMAEAIAAGKFAKPVPKGELRSYTLPTLMAVPKWAAVPGTAPYMTGVLTEEGEKAWAEYCRLAVQEYAKRNPDREERIYQLTWEPVYPWGFKGTNEDLIRIYEIAYPIIHEADPKAVVAGPTNGVRGHEIDVQIKQFQLGLGKYLDMYSAHPYYPIDAEKAGLWRELRRMRQALDDFSGKKNMPMIGTEQGYSTEELVEKELTQARGSLRQNLIMLGEGWRFNFAFYIVDYHLSGEKGYGYYYNLMDGVPWGPARVAPRPIVPAYAAQSLLLDGSDSLGAIEWLGSTSWGYAFERDGEITLALWDWGGEKRQVSMPAGVRSVKVYDWMGNATEVQCPMGSLTVELGPEPIYVVGVSPHIWGPAERRMLSLETPEIRMYPGTTAKVTGKLRAGNSPVSGQIILEGEGITQQTRNVNVAAGESIDYSFDLALPASADTASVPLKVMLVSDEIQVAAAGGRLHVDSPVTIVAVAPTFEGGEAGVAVTIKDERGEGFSGNLSATLNVDRKDLTQQAQVSLAAGETRRMVLKFPGLDVPGSKMCELKTVLSADSGSQLTHSDRINFLPAARMSAVIDGAPGEWGTVRPTRLAGKSMVIRSPEHFSEGFSADLRYAWDERNVYVLAEVTDQTHVQKETGDLTWRGDCLQLAFNLDPFIREEATANVLDTNVRRATELNVALTESGVQTFRSVTYDSTHLPQGLVAGVKANVKRDGSRTIYEVAIPWKELGAESAPDAGSPIGLAAAVNDSNSADQKSLTGLGLFGGIHPQKQPELFGLLVLSAE